LEEFSGEESKVHHRDWKAVEEVLGFGESFVFNLIVEFVNVV
jgi:hypothetical protein